MVKITPELLTQCAQYINPLKDRELDLRGYKITVIENLGATLDQFDCIDLSDNEIRKLDGFPLLKRIKYILLNNNNICRIGDNLNMSLPNLTSLVLSNNNISELSYIDNLKKLKKLQSLSLLGNPITKTKDYRLYIINTLPNIKLLDFKKIKLKERNLAKKAFKQQPKKVEENHNTFVPGEMMITGTETKEVVELKEYYPKTAASKNLQHIKDAISKATTLEEVERLQQLLSEGMLKEA